MTGRLSLNHVWFLMVAAATICLAAPAYGSPVEAARVVVVKGNVRVAGKPIMAEPLSTMPLGSTVATGRRGWVKLLTVGGCVLEVGPSSELGLIKGTKGGRCPALRLRKGTVYVAASSQSWVNAEVDGVKARVLAGRARLFAGKNGRVCALDGRVEVRVKTPAATGAAPSPPSKSGPAASPVSPPAFQWKPLAESRCLAAGRVTAFKKRDGVTAFPAIVPAVLPKVTFDLKPLMPKRRKSGSKGGSEGPGQVSAAGGSMCLDSSGSGSAAGNVQQGPQPIDKPPPTTRLRVRVIVPGR